MLDLAGDLIGAATALAGLLLVFLGNISSGFDSYAPTERKSVHKRYSRRGWVSFASFALALLCAVFALFAKLFGSPCLAGIAFCLLLASLLASIAMALAEVLEIK